MTKQDQVLDLLAHYVDGLTGRNLQKKLPVNWFIGADHYKEVRNALERLKAKRLIRSHDPAGNGATYWQVTDAGMAFLNALKSEEITDDGQGESLPPIPDGALVAASSVLPLEVEIPPTPPGVEFREFLPEPAPFEVMPGKPDPIEGVEFVQGWRTEDGKLFDSPALAIRHRDGIRMDRLMSLFLDHPSSGLHEPLRGRALLKAWESFKIMNGAAHA